MVAAFLEDYVPFITDALFADNVLSSYIEKSNNPTLEKWTVAFVKGSGSAIEMSDRLSYAAPKRAVKKGKAVTLCRQPGVIHPVQGLGQQ